MFLSGYYYIPKKLGNHHVSIQLYCTCVATIYFILGWDLDLYKKGQAI